MPKEILIIEDETGILMSLKDEFELQGYIVHSACLLYTSPSPRD